MLKFSIDNGRVKIDPLSIQLAGLRRIYEEDESVLKETAIRVLTYIHIVSQLDPDAPYYTASFSEVRPLAKNDLFGDYEFNFPDEEFIDDCVVDYQKAYEEPEARALRVFNKKIDEIVDEMDSKKIQIVQNTVKGETKFASNYPIFEKMMGNIGKVLAQKQQLADSMKKEKKNTLVVRGGKQLSRLEEKLRGIKKKNSIEEDEEELEEVEDVSEPSNSSTNNEQNDIIVNNNRPAF